jgi:hypothetical protein
MSGGPRGRAVAFVAAALGGVVTAAPIWAQDEPIADNSFLIEEAYNQETGVVQHVSTFVRAGESSEWASSFTQEWPAPSQRHQLSYTLSYLRLDAGAGSGSATGLGDVALNYRYQLRGFADDPVAIAPRVSLLVPTGDPGDGLGAGSAGLQINLPVSARLAERWVAHWNAGASFVPDAEAPSGAEADVTAVSLGQSFVWLARPKLNLLVEAIWTSAQAVTDAGGTVREESFLIAPGLRFARDLPSGLQIVPGLAVPIGVGPSEGDWSVFLYLSFEHPFGS